MSRYHVIGAAAAGAAPITGLKYWMRGIATPRIAGVLRALVAASVLVLLVAFPGHVGHARDRLSGEVQRVKMIGFTVADVDREANFFAEVLQFEKVSDFRVVGSEFDKMEGVFNANMRIVHLKLGEQVVELTQYVSPPTGRPIPVPSYSNDAWFQHMAIVVSDMDAAYKILQENNVQQISANPITIPEIESWRSRYQGDQVPRCRRS